MLNEIIKWSNDNNGFLIGVLTLVYVITTLAILISMLKANRLTSKSIQQAEFLEQQRKRPFLSFWLEPALDENQKVYHCYVILKNTGLTIAKDIEVKTSPTLQTEKIWDGKKQMYIPVMLRGKIDHLFPDQQISDHLGFTASIYDATNPAIFNGSIIYKDSQGKKYKENFVLDLELQNVSIPMGKIKENA